MSTARHLWDPSPSAPLSAKQRARREHDRDVYARLNASTGFFAQPSAAPAPAAAPPTERESLIARIADLRTAGISRKTNKLRPTFAAAIASAEARLAALDADES